MMRALPLSLVTGLAFALTGCGAVVVGDGDGDADGDGIIDDDDRGNGTLTIFVATDSHADIQELSLDVAAMRILGDPDEGTEGWVELDGFAPQMLLITAEPRETEVVTDQVPAGDYSQIELEVAGMNYLNDDGDRIDVVVPDVLPNGVISIEYDFDVSRGQQTTLVADPEAEVVGNEDEGYGFDIDVSFDQR